jgi:hypothetical protein
MSERGFRLGGWQALAVIGVLAVVVIAVLVRTAPPPAAGSAAARGGPVDSVAIDDSLEEYVEQRIVRETMTLAEVASRADIPVDSLVAELRLPASTSLTVPLRAILLENHLSVKDIRDARRRVEARLRRAAGHP